MDFIGFDLGKISSQVCILTEDGELIERRIRTDRDHFNELLGSRPPARILIETSTESEWVARHLENLGHEVVIADTNFAPMYATRSRKVKTDKRDARTLAEACRLGAYRPAHRTSDRQRHVRAQLAVREAMVRTRSRYVSLISTLLRRDGLRVAPGHSAGFLKRLARVVLPEALREEVAPLVLLLQGLTEQIKAADERLAALAKEDEVVARLCTAPGVGPVTAASFVSALDEADRFAGPKQARAYLGLVPSERSSGERQQRGHISKAGPGRARYMLVEAAWTILRRRSPTNSALHEWATGIAARRGSRVAVIALARKLAGILYAMWRDGTTFGAHAGPAAAAA
ncbi:MAG: IS110 family transposase [Acidobacteriota bacterium]|nr:IS110 family transposase [Acidobacteriota bacterium]